MMLVTSATTSNAATVTAFYVDRTMSTCSDSGSGTPTAPFCTITKGVSKLAVGLTLYIGDGTYSESIKFWASGTATSPITITAWPGRSPVVGTGVTYGTYLSGRSYVTVSNLTFTGTTSDGIYVTGSDHITITGNTVTNAGQQAKGLTAHGISIHSTTATAVSKNNTNHNSDHGIFVTALATGITVSNNQSSFNAEGWQRNASGIDVISAGNTVIGNVTHDNEDSGIQFFSGGNNNVATLNVSYNNGDHGIDDVNVTGGRIIGNTVFHNCTSGINVEGTSGNYLVENNVAVDNAIYPAYGGISCARRTGNIGIWDSAPPTTTVDHNLVWLTKTGTMYVFGSAFKSLSAMQAATGQEQAGVQADPKVVSAAGYDLRLTERSPAIDRADSGLAGEQPNDILGNPRVRDPNVTNNFAAGPRLYDDLGAYEFQPAPSKPPTAALSVSPATGVAPLAVTADASASSDPQGQALSYAFNFGDGTTLPAQSGATATHRYTTPGTYTVTVTATNTAALSATATATVAVTAAQPPTAALSVTPATGVAPLAVTADASASSDPQGQALSYAFNFGDGTTLPAQSGATATHRYTTPGTYTVTVTATNTAALSATATATVTVTVASLPAYVNQIATNYSTSAKTSGAITVWRSAGVQAGDLVVVTLQLSGTAPTGPVTVTDDKANIYTLASSVANATGGRLVVLSGIAVQPLAVGAKITVTFPSSTGYRMLGDEFTGVSHVDTTAASSGTAATFGSGPTNTTSTAREVVYGSVALFGGTANPVWSIGWRDMSSYSVAPSYLGRAYQLPTTTGSFTATGSATGSWLAMTVTFAP